MEHVAPIFAVSDLDAGLEHHRRLGIEPHLGVGSDGHSHGWPVR